VGAALADSQRSPATINIQSVRVYPNPWRSDRGYPSQMTFDQMTPNSTVKIFTISAHYVRTLQAPSGSVPWDLKNENGDRVASGIYLFLATDDHGNKARGKFAVIR